MAFLDGPAGTQVPRECIDAIVAYLENSEREPWRAFITSHETDAMMADVHAAAADFLGAADGSEITFGANMTTLTFAVSRAIGRTLKAGDEIVVTQLDHDGDVAPWLAMAEERGVVVSNGRRNGRKIARSTLTRWRPRFRPGRGCGRRHPRPNAVAHPARGADRGDGPRRGAGSGRTPSMPVRICPSTSPRWAPTS